ncbi:hypothetical protein [Aquibacillus kalidii]|uniref:hypothetical protein n=1 Tax=Aquibacillus kalidii TaxID=2762597 RepID=UPI001649654D|nr:hypothetical protein [Aquibacillus kalidii]
MIRYWLGFASFVCMVIMLLIAFVIGERLDVAPGTITKILAALFVFTTILVIMGKGIWRIITLCVVGLYVVFLLILMFGYMMA